VISAFRGCERQLQPHVGAAAGRAALRPGPARLRGRRRDARPTTAGGAPAEAQPQGLTARLEPEEIRRLTRAPAGSCSRQGITGGAELSDCPFRNCPGRGRAVWGMCAQGMRDVHDRAQSRARFVLQELRNTGTRDAESTREALERVASRALATTERAVRRAPPTSGPAGPGGAGDCGDAADRGACHGRIMPATSRPSASRSALVAAAAPGLHEATLDELEQRFATNPRRRSLHDGLRRGCGALQAAGCAVVFVDGSYVTDKPIPGSSSLLAPQQTAP